MVHLCRRFAPSSAGEPRPTPSGASLNKHRKSGRSVATFEVSRFLSSRAIWRCRCKVPPTLSGLVASIPTSTQIGRIGNECFDLSTAGARFLHWVAATTTVKQYKKPNLEGLDLGGLKGQKKRHTYSCHCFFFPSRVSRPVAPPESPPPPPKPARERAAKAPKPKPDRHKGEYEPTSEEIEAHKREFRERRRSETLKPS